MSNNRDIYAKYILEVSKYKDEKINKLILQRNKLKRLKSKLIILNASLLVISMIEAILLVLR
jgi:hypothetical protein